MHIEEISLSLFHCPAYGGDDFRDGIPMEWSEVDAIVAGRFSNLKSVSAQHTRSHFLKRDTPYSLEWLCDQLPLCHKRGILRWCETGTHGPFI
jgi:hypothetical protein